MSIVRKPNKFVNITKRPSSQTGPFKMKRYKSDHVDWTKAKSLSSWLFLKYDMDYKSFCRKSKKRKDELRKEYYDDTGNTISQKEKQNYCDDFSN